MAERVQIDVNSDILGKHRVFSGTNYDAVLAKAQSLYKTWEIEENVVIDVRKRNFESKAKLEALKNLLLSGLKSQPIVDWKKLIAPYPKPKPQAQEPKLECLQCPDKPPVEQKPKEFYYAKYPPEPTKQGWVSNELYDRAYLAWSIEVKKIEAENQRRYDESVAAIERWNSPERRLKEEEALAKWSEVCKQINDENIRRKDEHSEMVKRWKIECEQAVTKWNTNRIEYEESELARLKGELSLPNAITERCGRALFLSRLPDYLKGEANFEYVPETKILIVDRLLPAPENLPRVKEAKWVKSRNQIVDVYISDKEFNQIYDDVLYQICLRSLYELFETDDTDALSAIVFNGWVESPDKATGKDAKGCVMSVHAKKEEFQKINLVRVEPKACFKALKGIGSSTLHSLTPIAPVLKINREDKRFVASHEVAGQLDERTNLAAMDWEDFEHLIRELFEKEFSKPGCEVRVTQASRDGGVDSVVLDSDPIHGGKTVIQAKRYTNTVGVAAVRELFGTVLNEGAMKGILVTTADYGPDAYEFAQGKPLVLLNGANLLHLLEKHGHKAKIDIKEAKRILGEKVSDFYL